MDKPSLDSDLLSIYMAIIIGWAVVNIDWQWSLLVNIGFIQYLLLPIPIQHAVPKQREAMEDELMEELSPTGVIMQFQMTSGLIATCLVHSWWTLYRIKTYHNILLPLSISISRRVHTSQPFAWMLISPLCQSTAKRVNVNFGRSICGWTMKKLLLQRIV